MPAVSRIGVTGGAGFLGHHLVDRLRAEGHDVWALDDLSTGSAANLAHLGATLIEGSVADPAAWARLPDVDVLFHLASPASPRAYQRDPLGTIAANVDGLRQALPWCTERGARLVYTSTSEVYGSPTVHPQTESYWGHVNPWGPRACYDESKRLGETLCWIWQTHHDADMRVARLFNTYGPRMAEDDGRLVPTLVAQALRGEPLTVHGSGHQTRSFAYVSDIIDGLVRLSRSDVLGPVNLGNPEERSVREVAELVSELTGGVPIVHTDADVDDPHRRRPDITRATRELGWSPRVPLREGLLAVLRAASEHLES